MAGRKMTYIEAVDACARSNGSLPKADTQETKDDLIRVMRTNNISSIWVRLYRQTFKNYQWNDKSILGLSTSSSKYFEHSLYNCSIF